MFINLVQLLVEQRLKNLCICCHFDIITDEVKLEFGHLLSKLKSRLKISLIISSQIVAVLLFLYLFYRTLELSRLQKAFQIIQSNWQPSITTITPEPSLQVTHPDTSPTLPEMVTSLPPSAIIPVSNHSFSDFFLS